MAAKKPASKASNKANKSRSRLKSDDLKLSGGFVPNERKVTVKTVKNLGAKLLG